MVAPTNKCFVDKETTVRVELVEDRKILITRLKRTTKVQRLETAVLYSKDFTFLKQFQSLKEIEIELKYCMSQSTRLLVQLLKV